MLEPGRYKWVRVSREDIGERGCGHWHVRPRLGLIGMLMGWWQVKLSSGCPLAGGVGRGRRPAPTPHRLSSWAVAVASAPAPRPPCGRSDAADRPAPGAAARAPRRRRRGDPPPAPWGSFPLAELCILLALVPNRNRSSTNQEPAHQAPSPSPTDAERTP